jgi:hypothetical protein
MDRYQLFRCRHIVAEQTFLDERTPQLRWNVDLEQTKVCLEFLMAGQALQLSIYTEMFPTRLRFSGVAVGTQFGYLLAGFAPTISYAILRPGPTGWIPVAVFGAACCLVAAAAAFTARETRGISIEHIDRTPSSPQPLPEHLA